MTNERLQSLFTLPMDEQLRLFGDMSTLYPTRLVRRGRSASEISIGKPIDLLYRVKERPATSKDSCRDIALQDFSF